MSILKSFSFRKLLYNRRFTIPFSVMLSFVLWIIITVNQKPTMERSFSDMTVAINMQDTFAAENGMSIVGDISEQKFTVVVRGPNQQVSAASVSDINLFASAAEVDSPGEYKLEVSATQASANSAFEILRITPKTVKVNFDYIETKEFPIVALAEGVTADKGLIAEAPVVGGIENNTISITGPRTVLNKIDTVKAETSVNQTLSESTTFDADVILYNARGKKIENNNLTLSTEKVKLTVPVSKKKTVPVKVDFSNVPKDFNKNSIRVKLDHANVVVIGTPETVNKTKQITLSPIDITTLTKESNSYEISPKLPEGVRLLDAIEYFVVECQIADYSEKTVTVSRVKYTGLSPNLKTSGTESLKNVKICGPKSVLENLDETKIYAEVDLKNKKNGEHTVDAAISFDGYKDVWAIGSYKTTVSIK